MRSYLALPAVLLCLLILAACGPKTENATTTPPVDSTAQMQAISMVVHLPDSQPNKVWEVEAGAEMTVRDLMVALRDAQFSFNDTLYPAMGHLVTSVAGIRNAGADGAYWQFCIDNVASDRGVDEKMIGPGHQVDWHYAKYGELPCKKIGE